MKYTEQQIREFAKKNVKQLEIEVWDYAERTGKIVRLDLNGEKLKCTSLDIEDGNYDTIFDSIFKNMSEDATQAQYEITPEIKQLGF